MDATYEARWAELIRALAPGLPDTVAFPEGAVARLVEKLTDRERKVLAMREGLGYTRTYVWREIGAEFNFSGVRARQIADKARRKLRRDLVEELRDKAGEIIKSLRPPEAEE